MVRYAKEPDVALADPAELSDRLTEVLRRYMPWLLTISEAEASVPEREGKWSAKQVVGGIDRFSGEQSGKDRAAAD